MTTEDRLLKLERSSRVWRTATCVLFVAGLCGANQDAGELRVRDLRIVDSRGKTRIRMKADDDGPVKNGYHITNGTAFVIFDENEEARVVLVGRSDQASVHLYHGHSLHQEADINLMNSSERGRYIDIQNNDRKIDLRVNGQNSAIVMKDQKSPAETSMTLDATKTPRVIKTGQDGHAR